MRTSTILCIALVLGSISQTAHAQTGRIGPSGAEAYGAIAGTAAGIAVVGVVLYQHQHHAHTLSGCVFSSADALHVKDEREKRDYVLAGDTDGIKAGQRVKLSGKKSRGDSSHRQFVVTRLSKDYGVCSAPAATP